MNAAATAKTIRTRVANADALRGVAVAYPNAPFTKPDDYKRWARLSVQFGETIQASYGASKRFRTPGVVFLSLFWPLEGGDAEPLELADKLAAWFRVLRVDGVVFRTPSVSTVGRSERWWQVNVSCPFYADETD